MQESRLQILQLLYQERDHPLRTTGVEELTRQLQVPQTTVWNELRYLEEKGYIAIKRRAFGTRVFFTIHITAQGIDVVEGMHIVSHHVRPTVAIDPSRLAIFISHSHHDNAFCYRLLAYLRQHIPTADIFYDDSMLRGGEDYMRTIPTAIKERPVFLVILSPFAVASNWVQQETNLALLLVIDNPERQIIPIRHEECDVAELNPFLKIRQIIDCTYQDESIGFAQLTALLQEM